VLLCGFSAEMRADARSQEATQRGATAWNFRRLWAGMVRCEKARTEWHSRGRRSRRHARRTSPTQNQDATRKVRAPLCPARGWGLKNLGAVATRAGAGPPGRSWPPACASTSSGSQSSSARTASWAGVRAGTSACLAQLCPALPVPHGGGLTAPVAAQQVHSSAEVRVPYGVLGERWLRGQCSPAVNVRWAFRRQRSAVAQSLALSSVARAGRPARALEARLSRIWTGAIAHRGRRAFAGWQVLRWWCCWRGSARRKHDKETNGAHADSVSPLAHDQQHQLTNSARRHP
jgi:hypothetical protein